MSEHVHEWVVDSYEPYAYCDKCSPDPSRVHGALMFADEIERRINATEQLSAEVATFAAEPFEKVDTAHFPGDHDGIGQALLAYASALEDNDVS